MLYTSEQFANKQFMESHDDGAQGVTDRQTDGRTDRQTDKTRTSSSRSCTDDDEYLREASRLSEHDRELG